MNYRLDLRSPEYFSSRRQGRIKKLAVLFPLLVILLVPLSILACSSYCNHVATLLSLEKQALQETKTNILPILEMQEEIKIIEARAALKKKIDNNKAVKSGYLLMIEETAQKTGLKVENISIHDHSNLAVAGHSSNLDIITVFNEKLLALPFVEEIRVTKVGINNLEGYDYTINGTINIERKRDKNDSL